MFPSKLLVSEVVLGLVSGSLEGRRLTLAHSTSYNGLQLGVKCTLDIYCYKDQSVSMIRPCFDRKREYEKANNTVFYSFKLNT